jgi:NitT/TauT family transport system ATP-binding protein
VSGDVLVAEAVLIDSVSMVFNPGRPNQVDALSEIDLSIAPGEFVSLIGPSGCGSRRCSGSSATC